MKPWTWIALAVLNFGVGIWAAFWPLSRAAPWFAAGAFMLTGACAAFAWRAKTREAIT